MYARILNPWLARVAVVNPDPPNKPTTSTPGGSMLPACLADLADNQPRRLYGVWDFLVFGLGLTFAHAFLVICR